MLMLHPFSYCERQQTDVNTDVINNGALPLCRSSMLEFLYVGRLLMAKLLCTFTLSYGFHLEWQPSCGHVPCTSVHMQKIKVSSHLAPKLEWKQFDGETDGLIDGAGGISFLATARVGNNYSANVMLNTSLFLSVV